MTVPADDTYLTHLAETHANVRRRRWIWLVIIFVLIYTLDVIEQLLMQQFNPVLVIATIWLIGTALIVWLSLHLWKWIDNGLAHIAAIERERQVTLNTLHQLEAARATGLAIAHNLNQPITVIAAYTQIYLDTPLAERDDADLREILRAAERAAILVRQFQSIEQYRTVRYAGGRNMLDLPENYGSNGLYT